MADAGDAIDAPNAGWGFGSDVPERFDAHVRRSVPFYDEGHGLIVQLSDFYIGADALVYELGCSTGTLTHRLAEHHRERRARFIAIDAEPAMVQVAAERWSGASRPERAQRQAPGAQRRRRCSSRAGASLSGGTPRRSGGVPPPSERNAGRQRRDAAAPKLEAGASRPRASATPSPKAAAQRRDAAAPGRSGGVPPPSERNAKPPHAVPQRRDAAAPKPERGRPAPERAQRQAPKAAAQRRDAAAPKPEGGPRASGKKPRAGAGAPERTEPKGAGAGAGASRPRASATPSPRSRRSAAGRRAPGPERGGVPPPSERNGAPAPSERSKPPLSGGTPLLPSRSGGVPPPSERNVKPPKPPLSGGTPLLPSRCSQAGADLPTSRSAKARSLKGVLEPFSSQGNLDLMRRAGFVDIMTVYKYICFEGFLAIKQARGGMLPRGPCTTPPPKVWPDICFPAAMPAGAAATTGPCSAVPSTPSH